MLKSKLVASGTPKPLVCTSIADQCATAVTFVFRHIIYFTYIVGRLPEAGMARFDSTCKHCRSSTELTLLHGTAFLAFFLPTTGPFGPYTLQSRICLYAHSQGQSHAILDWILLPSSIMSCQARQRGTTKHTCTCDLRSGKPQTHWLGPMPHPEQQHTCSTVAIKQYVAS